MIEQICVFYGGSEREKGNLMQNRCMPVSSKHFAEKDGYVKNEVVAWTTKV
ncbi:hypothetical protein Plhal304r1_c008g0032861 [Plasmopara halstedii]